MADITSSLFPEVGSLFQRQQQQNMANAAAAAQGGSANALLGSIGSLGAQAGGLLGKGIAGAFGMTSPEEDEIKATKEIADRLTQSGVNLQSYEGMSQLAQELNQQGKYNAANKAMTAANVLREKELKAKELESQISLQGAQAIKAGREQLSADPIQQLIRTGKYTPESIQNYLTSKGDINKLELVEKNQANPNIQKLIEYRNTLTDPKEIAQVDAVIKSEGEGKGTKIVMPSQEGKDVVAFVTAAQTAVKPYTEAIDTADQTLNLLDNAFKSNNPQSYSQAIVGLSSIIQGGKISNQDIARAGGNPAVFETIKDYVSGKLTGLPSVETGRNIYATAKLLRKIAEDKRNSVVEDQKRIARVSKMSPDIMNELFQAPGGTSPKAPVSGSRTTKSGVSYTVEGQ